MSSPEPDRDGTHGLLADDASLAESLQGVAAVGCSLLTGCEAASVTLLQLDRPMTVASTSELALALDMAQYEEDDGPCLTAAREERVVLVDDVTMDMRWPRYSKAAIDQGVCSSLSIPLVLHDGTTFGGLNYYATSPGAFEDGDLEIAQTFAGQASVVVANAISYWRAFDQAAQLTHAMEHRAEIEQAKGILMATQKCTADEAFDLLRRASQRENRKLRDVAAELVARTIGGTS
jgi:GAF domain-containing protein